MRKKDDRVLGNKNMLGNSTKKVLKLVSMFTLALLVAVPSINVSQIRAISVSTPFEETSKEESEVAEDTKEENESIEKEAEEQLPVIELENKGLNTVNKNTTATDQSWFTFEGNTLTGVTNGDDLPQDIVIPSSYIGEDGHEYSITKIGENALGSTNITSITIPDRGEISIEAAAFESCSNLTTANLGNSVTSIGIYAFASCPSLTTVNLGDSVTIIGYRAFAGTPITSITIPDSVKSIEEEAFSGCYSLATVDLGEGVTTIGTNAFADSGITSITIPNSVRSIGVAAFNGCNELTTIDLGSGVESIGDCAFQNSAITSIIIPDSVESLGFNAFCCDNLTTVNLGNGLMSIGSYAFAGATVSHRLRIPSSIVYIHYEAFKYANFPMLLIDKDKADLTSSGNEPWGLPAGTPVYYRGEFELLEYTIAYNTGFDDVPIDSKTNVNIMNSDLLPRNPSKLGYTFKNWTFGTTEVSSSTALEKLVTNEADGSTITLTANWDNSKYTIKYDTKFAEITVADKENVVIDQSSLLPSVINKKGYTFDGWYVGDTKISETTTLNNVLTSEPVDGIVSFVAKWYENTYTVAYNTGSNDVVESKANVKLSDSNLLPSDPSKLGYTFKNWTFGTTVVSSSTALEKLVTNEADGSTITLTANWDNSKYTIKYDTKFAEITVADKENVVIDQSSLLPSVINKKGYTFDGWYVGDTKISETTTLNELLTSEPTNGIVTFVAKWSKENYQIDFEYKGETPKDTPVPKSVTVEYEGILNEPSIAPVNKWTFVGWYSDEACTQLFDFLTGIEENMTLYGVWSYHEDPTPPSNSNSSKSNVKGYVTRTGKKVKVNEIRTSKVMKDLLGNENVITSIKVVDANEPVTVTVNVGKKLSNKNVYIVQLNPNSQLLELISIAQVNKEGEVQFETSSKEEITITTGIPNGFITTVETASTKPMTYFMMENKEFKKGWLKTDSNDYYFFDYKSGEQQKNKWVADGTDTHGYVNWYSLSTDGKMHQSTWIAQDATGAKWYYVNSLGKMVSSTTVDGYIIDVNGVWTK